METQIPPGKWPEGQERALATRARSGFLAALGMTISFRNCRRTATATAKAKAKAKVKVKVKVKAKARARATATTNTGILRFALG